MIETFRILGILVIAVVCNILCGLYYNVNVKKMSFDKIKLSNGIIKAGIVGVVALGISYVFIQMPSLTEAIGITPNMIMNSAIILYVGKVLVGLGKILGVTIKIKEKE